MSCFPILYNPFESREVTWREGGGGTLQCGHPRGAVGVALRLQGEAAAGRDDAEAERQVGYPGVVLVRVQLHGRHDEVHGAVAAVSAAACAGSSRVALQRVARVVLDKETGTVLHFRTIRLQSRGFKQI